MAAAHLRSRLEHWFSLQKRDLPWRRGAAAGQRDAYATWIAEVMLQQTRVEVAGPYWERFLALYPNVRALAAAPEQEVLRAWAGLGYYRRARMLHAAATELVRDRAGSLPTSAAGWRELPGIGPYTAAAIAAQAHGEAIPAVDGNVKRVAARVLGLDLPADARALHQAAEAWAGELLRDGSAPGVIVEALMELGATVCVPAAPRCELCPLVGACAAQAAGNAADLPRAKTPVKWRDLPWIGFVARRGAGWLLRTREDGWNSGLWEPPTALAQPGETASAAWRRLDCGRAGGFTEIGIVKHTITRHRLLIRVFAVEDWRGGPRAVRLERVGLSGMARKMLLLGGAVSVRA